MKSYSEKVKVLYKLLSKVYDLMDFLVFPVKKYNPRYGLSKHIPNNNISVLDVCSGTGNSSIAIATKNNRNRITCLDLSEDMLKISRRKLRKNGIKNISTYCMDATNIELKEEFDIVTTSLSLHEMPKDIMNSVVSEMCRVLKSDGKMYIIEWNKPNNFLGSIVFMSTIHLLEPKGFDSFLKLDWDSYLKQYGMKIEQIEKYTFTKLIVVSKIVEACSEASNNALS